MDDRIVDACAMQLVMNPWQFDVDRHHQSVRRHPVRPDVGAGRRPRHGARRQYWARSAAIFEAVHGSAPDIAGKGIANPLALLMATGSDAPKHVDRVDLAARLQTAIDQTLKVDGVGTAISAARHPRMTLRPR